MMRDIKTKNAAEYDDDVLISKALRCLEERMKYKPSETLSSSRAVCDYLRLQLAEEKNEVFGVLFLDNKHRFLGFEKLFYGTINSSVIHPRCIIQRALEYNAAAIIAAHNHPSGNSDPSNQDEVITKVLKDLLEVMDINLLDHVVVTRQEASSFADLVLL